MRRRESGKKWRLRLGFRGHIGIIDQQNRYTESRKGGGPMTDLVMRALGLKKEVASQEETERLELMDGL